jgi:hypothetical protein
MGAMVSSVDDYGTLHIELVSFFRATDLGISHWHRNKLSEVEVIPMDGLSGRFCFGHIKFAKKRIWVAFSLDHVGVSFIIICAVKLTYQSLIRQHKNLIRLIQKRMIDTGMQFTIFNTIAIPNYIIRIHAL